MLIPVSIFREYSPITISWTWPTRLASLTAASALVVIAAISAGPAAAAGTPSKGAEIDWTQPGAWNGLTAPDAVSASMFARLKGQAVEDLSQRTESSQTFALPDGQWRSDMSMGPEWVSTGEDPTTEAGWKPLDTDLVPWTDGSYRPGAHPAALVFSGATDGPAKVVSGVNSDGGPFELWWDGNLPAPVVEGDAIRYVDVRPDIDLVFLVTATGYEQFFVAKTPEALDHTSELSLSFTSPDAPLKVKSDTLVVSGGTGAAVADVSGVAVWDAESDANRMNPVAGMAPDTRSDESPTSSSPQPAEPPSTSTDLNAAPDATAIDADTTVKGDTGTLSIDTDDVPVDSATQFPVVIDPSVNLTLSFDTYVCSICTPDHSSDTELLIGTPDSGNGKYRAFMNVKVSPVIGKKITAATLKMYEFHSWSCTAKSWEVWSTSTTSSSTRWSNMPALGTKYATTTATKGYSSSCADGTVTQDVTSLVQAWANSTTTTRGLALKATSETDNFYWKRFYSGNSSSNKPVLSVTYNSYPSTPTAVKVNGVSPAAGTTFCTNDTTPTFSATVSDSDGGSVKGMFALNGGTAVAGSSVTSGSASSYTPSARANGSSTTVSVAASDGTLTSKASIAPSWTVLVDTTAPDPVGFTSAAFTNGQWKDVAPPSVSLTLKSPGASAFEYTVDNGAAASKGATADTATLDDLPRTVGKHVITVAAKDCAGNTSPTATFTYGIGSLAISAPQSGQGSIDLIHVASSASPGDQGKVARAVYWRAAGTSDATESGYDAANGSSEGWTLATDLGSVAMNVDPSVATDIHLRSFPIPAGQAGPPENIDVQVCYSYYVGSATVPYETKCTWNDDPATHRTVTRVVHAFYGSFPTAPAGPGDVALTTGELSVASTDVEVRTLNDVLSIGRAYMSYDSDATSPFGPHWQASFGSAGATDFQVTDTISVDKSVTFVPADGTPLVFALPSSASTLSQAQLAVWSGDLEPVGDDAVTSGYTVARVHDATGDYLVLTDDSLVATIWKLNSGAWQPSSVRVRATDSTTGFDYENGQLRWIIAAYPAGIQAADGSAPPCSKTTLVPGCSALELSYYGSTNATGAYEGRVSQIVLHSWNPGRSGGPGMDSQQLMAYTYTPGGDLATVKDLRTDLTTTYAYLDSNAGQAIRPLASIGEPGLAPWHFEYEAGTGRLLNVTRDNADGTPGTSTLAHFKYDVATSAMPSGAPGIVNAIKSWGQDTWGFDAVPSLGFAVYGQGSDSTSDAKDAQWFFTNASGAQVNKAVYGAGAWNYETTRYDDAGKTVLTLDSAATTELQALSQLNGNRAVAGDQVISMGTVMRYNGDYFAPSDYQWGTDPSQAVGTGDLILPAGTVLTDVWLPVADDAGAGPSRAHAHYEYDEGAPNGGLDPNTGDPFGLTTTITVTRARADTGTWVVSTPVAIGEVVLSQSKFGYDPVITGDPSGWTLGSPTTRTAVMANPTDNIVYKVRYDAVGREIETRSPGSTGNDAATHQTVYYTAGANGDDPACGLAHPEWAGLECVSRTAETNASVAVTRTTGYSMLLAPTEVTETLGSTIRTTKSTYLADGRLDTTSVGIGATSTTALPTTQSLYRASTGQPVGSQTLAPDGHTVTGSATTSTDLWGRVVTYSASNGDGATYVYDAKGHLASVDDHQHKVSYTYDGTDALGNSEHRGLVTGLVVDGLPSGTGNFSGAYDAAGNLVVQQMPGGVTQESTYSMSGNQTSLMYTGVDEDNETVPLVGWTQDFDLFSRVVHETSPTDAQGVDSMAEYLRTYSYDRAGRLVAANDRTAGPDGILDEDGSDGSMTPCATRAYAFDARGNRLSRTTTTSGADGTCGTGGVATELHTYDSADRIQTGANNTGTYVYDDLGRQTTLPGGDTPAGAAAGNLQVAYFDNDLVKSLTQDGSSTSFVLDALQRRDVATTVAGSGTTTEIRHYADTSDNPAWVASTGPGNVLHTSWYGESIGGRLGVTVTDGTVSLSIAGPHGSTATSLALGNDGAVLEVGGYSDYDEYGRAISTTFDNQAGAVRYGWLGAHQRATDGTGLVLMGARLYNPVTGQFTSRDPIKGGNTAAYAYPQDPLNLSDLTGKFAVPVLVGVAVIDALIYALAWTALIVSLAWLAYQVFEAAKRIPWPRLGSKSYRSNVNYRIYRIFNIASGKVYKWGITSVAGNSRPTRQLPNCLAYFKSKCTYAWELAGKPVKGYYNARLWEASFVTAYYIRYRKCPPGQETSCM
ncbi:DNRLRE domain-containing protein [Demequina sp.]|uniref:DNRLRE domain-containing protein n=1 Tax=Demequina sp. TaxID=2050685 RepID=UPI003D108F65